MAALIKQPLGSKQCGQASLAMLTGISLERAVELVGKKKGTKTKDLVAAARKLGLDCPDRLKVLGRKTLAELERALVKVKVPGQSNWHWIAVIDGKVFDPAPAFPFPLWGRATSYLPLYLRGDTPLEEMSNAEDS